MLNLIAILMGLAADAPVASTVPVLSLCDPASRAIVNVARNAPLQVHYAVENAPTCYSVTLTVDGKQVRGFVTDRKLEAVVAFEQSRLEVARETFSRPIPLPPSPSAPPPVAKEPEKPKAEVAKAQPKKPAQKPTFN